MSVDRGFAILERFSGEQGSESVAAISEAIELPRSSVHRYLQTLSVLGLVEQRGTPGRRYRLTANAASTGLVALAATGLPALVHGELLSLRQSTGLTARFAIRIGLDALLVDQAPSFAEGQAMLALDVRPGARLRGFSSALGQALIAYVAVERLPPSLRRQAAEAHAAVVGVRKLGYATEQDQRMCALAVPVKLDDGIAIAALELRGCAPQATATTLSRHLEALQRLALELAPRIAELPWMRWRPYTRRRDR